MLFNCVCRRYYNYCYIAQPIYIQKHHACASSSYSIALACCNEGDQIENSLLSGRKICFVLVPRALFFTTSVAIQVLLIYTRNLNVSESERVRIWYIVSSSCNFDDPKSESVRNQKCQKYSKKPENVRIFQILKVPCSILLQILTLSALLLQMSQFSSFLQ